MRNDWKASSQEFFAQRGRTVRSADKQSLAELCFVSGRDPRLWGQADVYDNLIADIVNRCAVTRESSILEVGCASGFLANGLAPHVREYVGIDLAAPAIKAAQSLGIANATFSIADGERLTFSSSTFDAVFSYDVFTNFPDFNIGAGIVSEMLRVTKPRGRVLVGSVPDAQLRVGYEARVAEVARELESRYGPPPPEPSAPSMNLLSRLRHWLKPVTPEIVCYYFNREDFLRLGEALGVSVELVDIHPMNPYVGYRFNAIYTKNGQ